MSCAWLSSSSIQVWGSIAAASLAGSLKKAASNDWTSARYAANLAYMPDLAPMGE